MKLTSLLASTLSALSLSFAIPQISRANPKSCTMDYDNLHQYPGLRAIPYGRDFTMKGTNFSPIFYMPYDASRLVLVFRVTGRLDSYKIINNDQITAMFIVGKQYSPVTKFAWMCVNGEYRLVNKKLDMMHMPVDFQSAVQQTQLNAVSVDTLQLFK